MGANHSGPRPPVRGDVPHMIEVSGERGLWLLNLLCVA
jgi:hypothetical protein